MPLGLPYDQDLLVRIKLQLKKDGTIMKSEVIDHERMNKPGQKFYKVLASALQYDCVNRLKSLQLVMKNGKFTIKLNPTEMLKG